MSLLNLWKKSERQEEHTEINKRLDALEVKTEELSLTMRRLEIDTEAFMQKAQAEIREAT